MKHDNDVKGTVIARELTGGQIIVDHLDPRGRDACLRHTRATVTPRSWTLSSTARRDQSSSRNA